MEFALAFTAGQPPGRVSDTGAPVRTSLTNSGEVNDFVLSAEGSKWQDRLWFIVVVIVRTELIARNRSDYVDLRVSWGH
jgi:hypothetical protein